MGRDKTLKNGTVECLIIEVLKIVTKTRNATYIGHLVTEQYALHSPFNVLSYSYLIPVNHFNIKIIWNRVNASQFWYDDAEKATTVTVGLS